MIGFIVLPIAALAAYALGGLDYLRGLLSPPAAETEPVQDPFIPPFEGGQCLVQYTISLRIRQFQNGSLINTNTIAHGNSPVYFGAIRSIQPASIAGGDSLNGYKVADNDNAGNPRIRTFGSGFSTSTDPLDVQVDQIEILRADSQPDNCGNLPNPNEAPLVSEDGIADSGDPDFDDDEVVITGSPIVLLPNFLPVLAAAIAAARAALDALTAIKAIANAIEAIADLLDKIKDRLDDDKKDKDDRNKTISRHSFGSIKEDGYLRLYPSSNLSDKRAIYLDLQFQAIPVGYGKYFGKLSPNYYRFKSLGYIAFTSPTFGVMDVKELEFSRVSLEIPENASGFYYHLGLDGAIIANISAYYREIEE